MTRPGPKSKSRLKRAWSIVDIIDKGYTALAFLVLGVLIVLTGLYYLITALF